MLQLLVISYHDRDCPSRKSIVSIEKGRVTDRAAFTHYRFRSLGLAGFEWYRKKKTVCDLCKTGLTVITVLRAINDFGKLK
jgi:hypothetical protein